jgi:hypothetical protein
MILLANYGALVTALLGCFGLICPAAVCHILGVGTQGPLGVSEVLASRSWQNVVGILFEASVGAAMSAARV